MEEELIIPEQVSEEKTEKLIEEQIPEEKPVMMPEQISEKTTEKLAEEQMPEEEDVEQQEDTTFVDLSQLSREELLEKLTDIYQEKLFKEKKTLLNNIRSEYRKLQDKHEKELADAFVPTEENPEFIYVRDAIDQKFSELQSFIRKELEHIREEEEEQKKQNFEKKLAVMEELRQLVESESADNLKEIYDAFNALKDRWKEIGAVPMEKNNDLWMNYNVLVEKFFNKVRMFRDMRDLDMQKNLELKIQLCEYMEDLLLEKSFNKAFQMLKEYWEKWQEIGPVPIDKKDEIWDRFKAATDAVHQKRREFFASQQDELNNNLLAKNALIDKMKEISEKEINNIKEWTATDKEVNEVFELWKSIGRVGQKNEDIWEDFRNLRANYFTKRREFFGEIKEKQNQNLNAKINLCIQAEAIAERNDWKKATEELLALQEEWKSIGYVPTAKVDAVWKRFRAAFDTFFDKKKAHFASQSSSEKDNLALKKALIEELSAYQETGNRQEQLDMVKQFQKRWTEIGHVPMSQKDKIYEEFRAAIDNLMGKFKINPAELRENAFVKRYAGIQTADDAKNISNKEAFALKKKIDDLKNNISTYENNMGFLLKSKNMEVLRKEYEDKIVKMKQEVALFEAKLKLILA